MQREGSAFSGLGVVMLKELSDHLTSIRLFVLEMLVIVIAFVTVYLATAHMSTLRGRSFSIQRVLRIFHNRKAVAN